MTPPGPSSRTTFNSLLALICIPLLSTIILYLKPDLPNSTTQALKSIQPRLSFLRSLSTISSSPSFSAAPTMPRAPVIALSHGGGPMPLLNDPSHKDMISSMRTRVPKILKLDTADAPRAIVLVTAHWSEPQPTISNAPKHKLLYDYYGFPPETYNLTYDAPGSPEVAKEVEDVFRAAGLQPQTDAFRGWDHGVFVPMLLINPAGSVPVVQVSVLESEDARQHFAMGSALAQLRDRNIAIVGSGFASIHNLRVMLGGGIRQPDFMAKNRKWSEELGLVLGEESAEVREKKLEGWRSFTGSYDMHPRDHAEHFMPLMVCAAAGGDGKVKTYSDDFNGLKVWSYYWE